jgi:dGTPase
MMGNSFYGEFDETCIGGERDPDYRTVFQRDRDRLIHTFAFRRLQDKTQVFMSGDYDFYRTRLTHSIEVAQIGRSICNYLRKEDPALKENFYASPALVEAACMAHDLGHPPFGHAGEEVLNELMDEYDGFEANAQTLRLLTETIYDNREGTGRRGMDPSRGLIDGTLKYKTLRSDHPTGNQHFIYDRQEHLLNFVMGDNQIPSDYSPGEERNSLRSLECQIMDWADDTAYSTNDLIDGIRAGFITADDIREWSSQQDLSSYEESEIQDLIDAIQDGYSEPFLSSRIGTLVESCSLEERSGFMSDQTNRYAYNLRIKEEARRTKDLYSDIAHDLLFTSPRVVQLEYKGESMLRKLFGSLTENYIGEAAEEVNLLPDDVHRRIVNPDHSQASELEYPSGDYRRARLLCDYVAGMTDGFATRTYKRLFDPDFGSIADLV